MFLDLSNRMLGQVCPHFSNNPMLHVGMESTSQFCQRAWRSRNDECLHIARADKFFHSSSYAPGEAMLPEFMPVSRLHAATAVCSCTLECASWAVAALLPRGRIFLDEDTLSRQIEKFLIANIAQKQRLAPITDEHQRVMGNSELVHLLTPECVAPHILRPDPL